MQTQQAYNKWAETYDSMDNKTRDLEQMAIRELLSEADFSNVLEIGCGTGKNTTWLAEKSGNMTAADFSEEMMAIAREKVKDKHISFEHADLTKPWHFKTATLITCSLVLEHIQDLDFIFSQASLTLASDGCFYVCELHPYKQLQGSRARFQHGNEEINLEYFVHHISDYFVAAKKNNLHCVELKEWFDDNVEGAIPRLVSFLFKKTNR